MTHHLRALAALAFGTLLVVAPVGCGSTPPPDGGGGSAGGLEEVAEVYKYIAAQKMRAPAKPADFEEYHGFLGDTLQRIRDGDYVVIYGAGYDPTSGQVLAYEKDTPNRGGKVLLRNGTVKQMTAEEFKATPKAGR